MNMAITDKLTPEAEAQRVKLEEQLERAETDKDGNGNLKYKNLGAHVLPLLQHLGLKLEVSVFYWFQI